MNDHDLLVRIDERVGDIQLDIEELKAGISTHCKRIGALERWRAYILGASGIIAFVVSIVAGVLW